MAVQTVPYVETALSHGAELFRRELQSGLPFGSAGGVVPATPAASANSTAGVAGCSDLQVTAPGSGMSVLVSAGQVIVPGTLGSGTGYGTGKGYGAPAVTLNGGSVPTVSTAAAATAVQLNQGSYYCYNDNSGGAVTLTIAASNPSNPRIDVIVAQVEDAAYSGSNNDWKLAVVAGTAAASPVVPTLPANTVVLAYVWVPATATSIITADIIDLRVAYNRNPFRAEMYRTAAYTQSASGAVTVPYDTVVYDPTASCTTGASALFTCPASGYWQVSAQIEVGPVIAADRYLLLLNKNGSLYRAMGAVDSGGTGGIACAVSTIVPCNLGDTLQLQGNMATTNVVYTPGQPWTFATFAMVTSI